MQIACPNCTTSYEIAASALGDVGRMVRCVRCNEQWFEPARADEIAEAGDSRDPGRQHAAVDNGFDSAPADGEVRRPPEWSDADAQWSSGDAGGDAASPVSPLLRAQDEVEFAPPPEMPTLADAPPIAPYHQGEAGPPAAADADGGPDYFELRRRRQSRAGKKSARRGPIVTLPRAIAVMAGLIVCLLLMRADVVRLLPQTASLYAAIRLPINLRGLTFENVKTVTEEQDGTSVLTISGTIRNVTRGPVDVPRIRFAVRNSAGADIYSWIAAPERTKLSAGEFFAFHTRLASPPAEGRGVFVRFVQRSDFVAADHGDMSR